MTSSETRRVDGGCHCGAVRFSATLDLGAGFRCNCSICAKVASTVGTCDPAVFELRAGEAQLASYRFGSGTLTRYFCRHCGVHCFARALQPDGSRFVGVNMNTLEGVEMAELPVIYFDGRHDVFEPRSTPAPILP